MKIACGNCGQRILVTAENYGTTGLCPNCENPIEISEEKIIPQDQVQEIQATSWIHELELLLRKMIIGIFRFIFWVRPSAICSFVILLFPWILRGARVLCIFGAWLVLVLWPWITIKWIPQKFPDVQMPAWVTEHPDLTYIAGAIWIALALIASIWGAIYVRLRRRKKQQK